MTRSRRDLTDQSVQVPFRRRTPSLRPTEGEGHEVVQPRVVMQGRVDQPRVMQGRPKDSQRQLR